MKILVTGATGFVGNHVVKELIKKDIELIVTSRNSKKAEHYPWFSQVRYIPCELREDREDFFSFFGRPDIMIHLAWEGLPNYHEQFHLERNVPVNYRFVKNMAQHGLKHVVVTGTCLEYGLQEGCLGEELETRPVVAYGLAKDALRKNFEQLFRTYPVIFQWLRLFYMYGDGQSPHSLLPQLEAAIRKGENSFNMSGGEQVRDYLAVEKVAEYIVAVALQDKVSGIINCCSGEPISIRKFVEEFIAKKGYRIKLNFGYYPYPDYEPMKFWGDNSRLKRILVGT